MSGAVLTGLGVYIILEARHWDYLAPDGPGPGFFPMWYGIALVVLSLVVVAGAVSRRADALAHPVSWTEVRRALLVWAVLTASIALIKVLGFLTSFALLTMFIACVMYRRSIVYGAAAGIGAALAFYLIFPLALNVALPVGLWGY